MVKNNKIRMPTIPQKVGKPNLSTQVLKSHFFKGYKKKKHRPANFGPVKVTNGFHKRESSISEHESCISGVFVVGCVMSEMSSKLKGEKNVTSTKPSKDLDWTTR